MKVFLALLAFGIITFTGCKTADNALFRPTAFQTNYVPDAIVLVRTQRVDVVLTTNVIGQTITNTVVVLATNAVVVPAHEVVKPTAWEPNPVTVGTVNAIGSAAGPWGALGAMAVTAILGGIAAFRGKQYKNAAISLAQGVQQVAEAFPTNAPAIFNTQKAVQDADGTRNTVRRLLSQVVKKPTPTA